MFRGDFDGYGGFGGWQRTFCDVDGAIKQKMQGILSGEMKYACERTYCKGGWWWNFRRFEVICLKCFLSKNCLTGVIYIYILDAGYKKLIRIYST